MAHENPLVSIGVPVYNEERYLSLTLESLLAQDYRNLELIISDNASTDRTHEISQSFVNRDPRVRYFCAKTNAGAVKNFNSAFLHAKGEYFMWAGAHDLWHASFISGAVSLLEADPRVVLVYPRTMLIDSEGHPLTIASDEMDTRNLSSLNRYLKLIWKIHSCNMMHGLIRSEVISNSGMFRNVWGSDILLLAELSLVGGFAQLPEVLFYRRENRIEQDETEWKQRYLTTLQGSYTPQQARASTQELFRQLRTGVLGAVKSSHLTYQQRVRACLQTMVCFRFRYGVSCPGGSLLVISKRITDRCKEFILKGTATNRLTA